MKMLTMIVTAGACAAAALLNQNAPAPGPDAAGQYVVDGVHSSVVFGVTHMGASRFYGRFNTIEGNFDFDPADPAKCRFNVEIDAASVDTANENRDKHLQSPDFLNVKQFPRITFKSKSLEKKGNDWTLKGDLTLHGVTREIEADFDWIGTGEARGKKKGGFETVFTIKRTDYDMGFMVGPLGDEVKLIVSLEGDAK